MEKGEYEAAQELYKQAYESTKSESEKKKLEVILENVDKILNNKKAENMSDEGWDAYRNGNYEVAKDKFAAALNKSSEDYENRHKFLSYLNQVKGRIFFNEGVELFAEGNYEEAIEKFNDAVRHNDELEYHDKIADCFHEIGNEFYNSKNLEKAKEFFLKAIDECSENYSSAYRFKESLDRVASEIKNDEAEIFNKEGFEAWHENNLGKAMENFSKAFNHCTLKYKNRNTFLDNMKHVEAAILNRDANEFYNNGEFQKAVQKYREAIRIIPSSKVDDLNKYKNQLANSLNSIGCLHMEREDFEEAKTYFLSAIEESGKNNENLLQIKNNLEAVEVGMKNKRAEKFMNEGKNKI